MVGPAINGGSGPVVQVPTDAGVHGGGHGGQAGAGGHGGVTGGGGAKLGGTGGATPATGGQAGSGTAGRPGSARVGGSPTGAAGGPADDPCTACEKARCSHPAAVADASDTYSALAAAIQVCFTGGSFPSQIASPSTYCSSGKTAANAEAGDAAGQAKTKLCQAFLSCVHRTNCTGEPDGANEYNCVCGANVTLQACSAPDFVLMGQCVTEYQNAVQSDQFATSYGNQDDICLASGAAYAINGFCDINCCPAECLGASPSVAFDSGYCNAPSSTSGSGGATGTGGAHGTGGTTASGGTTGMGGSLATGGTTGTGGNSPATSGSGGTHGTGGAGGMAGAPVTGSGGSPPPPAPAITNGTFDASAAGWTPSVNATLARSPRDAGGSAQSGSLDVSLTGDASVMLQLGATQCLSVTAGSTQRVQASVLVPAANGSQGSVTVWFYSSPDCSGPIASVSSTPASVTNAWQTVTQMATAPSGVASMQVRLTVYKALGQTSAEALFDDVTVTKP